MKFSRHVRFIKFSLMRYKKIERNCDEEGNLWPIGSAKISSGLHKTLKICSPFKVVRIKIQRKIFFQILADNVKGDVLCLFVYLFLQFIGFHATE